MTANIEQRSHEVAQDKHKAIEVEVNSRPVHMNERTVTGAEIKSAAIQQGVSIEQNFVLQQELPNGVSRIVGDDDEVKLHPHMSFTAIRADDNS
jgi:hypothetical protein